MALNHRWCVGVDLHKDTLTACVFCGCCGEVSFQKIACRCRRQGAYSRPCHGRTRWPLRMRFIAGCGSCWTRSWRSWCWPMPRRLRQSLGGVYRPRGRPQHRGAVGRFGDFPRATLRRSRCSGCGIHAPPQRLFATTRPDPASGEVDHERRQSAWPSADAKRRTDSLPQGPRREAAGQASGDALAVR